MLVGVMFNVCNVYYNCAMCTVCVIVILYEVLLAMIRFQIVMYNVSIAMFLR